MESRGLLELLAFHLHENPEEVGSNTSEGMPQQEHELASKDEHKKAENKSYPLPSPFL